MAIENEKQYGSILHIAPKLNDFPNYSSETMLNSSLQDLNF